MKINKKNFFSAKNVKIFTATFFVMGVITLVIATTIILLSEKRVSAFNDYDIGFDIKDLFKKNIDKPTPAVKPSAPPISTPMPTPPPTPTPVYTLNLTAVGDLMVHEEQLKSVYNKKDDTYNFDSGFKYVKKYLEQGDITIGNLETTFAGAEMKYSGYPMFNTPDSFGYALKNAGFDFVSTANNHCNDRKEQGILKTLHTLDKIGLDHTGTYNFQDSRNKIYMKEINNIKIAILSYTYGTNGIPLTTGKNYLVNMLDEELIKNDITAAKAQNPDIIVVYPHMGVEYETYPRDEFKHVANMMIESGADVVLASHPHVLQPMEIVHITDENGIARKGFIAYSLANFISSQRTIPRDTGIIVNMQFKKIGENKAQLVKVSYIPTWVTYINNKGERDVKTLPIHDALKAYEAGENMGLRPVDIVRMKEALKFVNKMMLNKDFPSDQLKNEYTFYEESI